MASPDPSAMARQLLHGTPSAAFRPNRGIAADPDALMGFQAGLMNLWMNSNMKGGALDAVKFQRFLADPKIARVVETVWKPAEIARLDKMVDIAVRAERGEIASFSQRALPTVRLWAKIIGAKTGRVMGEVTGQPTIQVPSIMSRTFADKATAWVKALDHSTSLVHAMHDPHYEALLLQSEPLTSGDGIKLLKQLRRVVRLTEDHRQVTQSQWEKEALGASAEERKLRGLIRDFR